MLPPTLHGPGSTYMAGTPPSPPSPPSVTPPLPLPLLALGNSPMSAPMQGWSPLAAVQSPSDGGWYVSPWHAATRHTKAPAETKLFVPMVSHYEGGTHPGVENGPPPRRPRSKRENGTMENGFRYVVVACVLTGLLALMSGCGLVSAVANPKVAWAVNDPAGMAVVVRREDAAETTAKQVDRI